ncbi:MAG: prolyl oligopeptidase family serine peptidase [Rhodothermaceae bacterium]|nr:prolyl oligopeptidase family serine peptidase [Rhodothermaceae bacterium]
MKRSFLYMMAVFFTACASETFEYPESKKLDVVDDYHGTEVADPYRWLEDPNAEDTKAWVRAQNDVTFPYLKSLPGRDRIESRLTTLWDYPRYSTPSKRGGHYFYSYNDGLQNQSVLYTMQSLDDEPRVLLDPNIFSEDGTVSLASVAISKNARYLMYGKSDGGSDWREFFVREIETGEDLDTHLKWIKFSSGSWTHDEQGFYYSRYPEPAPGEELTAENTNVKLYYHRLGTDQSEDVLIYERPDEPNWMIGGSVSHDGNYLIISLSESSAPRNRLYYQDISRTGRSVVKLIDTFEARYSYITNDGPVFYFQTDLDAPKNRVISIDLRNPAKNNWKTVIPEQEHVLTGISVVNNQFVASYLVDARSEVRIYAKDGNLEREVELPGIGSASGFSGERDDTEAFFAFTSYTYPTTIFRYDFTTHTYEEFRRPDVDFNPEEYVTEQVFYESKDGTMVPMFITYKKGLEKNGNNPTYLYGYGGFNVSMTPGFSVSNLIWMEMGGIYAVANLRGGGEYGREWHQAGTKENKQNVFDDFIAAAEFLLDEGYTSSSELAIGGGSNGGLLVAAAMVQRPDLFAVAMPAVGVLDMLRYHMFTIGWAWASDYGRSDNPEDFEYLYAYSPLHNLEMGIEYPATLITTAERDDRVVPAHSHKFAATLQEQHAGGNPVLIRIETRAGHGGGRPTAMIIEEAADRWAFIAKHTGLRVK